MFAALDEAEAKATALEQIREKALCADLSALSKSVDSKLAAAESRAERLREALVDAANTLDHVASNERSLDWAMAAAFGAERALEVLKEGAP